MRFREQGLRAITELYRSAQMTISHMKVEDQFQGALRPIASLISKSAKAQRKLAPGTWQHTLLRDNLKALHIASVLMSRETDDTNDFTQDELQEALCALASMISKAEKAQARFPLGTSQYTLQRNRLKALRKATALIKVELTAETSDKANVALGAPRRSS